MVQIIFISMKPGADLFALFEIYTIKIQAFPD